MDADTLIARTIQLIRFSAGERFKVFAILKALEEELVELLFYSGKRLTDITRQDKARLLKQAQDAINQYFGQVSDEFAQSLTALGRVEATATAAALGTVYAGAIVPALPPEGVLKRLVDDTLIMGAPNKAWWARQAGDLRFRFTNAVAQGIVQGESNDQIIRRVRGRAVGYKMVDGKRVYTYVDGVMSIARNHAASQVQTSIATLSAQARQDTYDENEDIIKGYRQLSTLDGHTTPTCVAYSGATWDAKKNPSGANTLPFISPKGAATGVPRHYNCRSAILPVLKTFRELGLDIDEKSPSTRAASGGPVAANETFEGYIRRRGDKFADELLGPGKAQMYLDGKLNLQQLVDQQSGRPLTLKELRKLYG